VDFVDDTGTVFIIWDSGSHLGAVFGEDEIRLLSKARLSKHNVVRWRPRGARICLIPKQCSKCDEMGFNELANFISTDTKRYANLILTGELENVWSEGIIYCPSTGSKYNTGSSIMRKALRSVSTAAKSAS
jgi:hypothetical protein